MTVRAREVAGLPASLYSKKDQSKLGRHAGMLVLAPKRAVALAIVVVACVSDSFAPLIEACAEEMTQVRNQHPGAPTRTQRLTLSDGRRVVIWDLRIQPGPGLSPTSMTFIWDADAPQSCVVCVPGSPGCVTATTRSRIART